MKPDCRKKALKFGGFITSAHDASDSQSAERLDEPMAPLQPVMNAVQTAWHKAAFPVRIIAQLRAAVASHLPVGYEDETGFHYGVDAGDWRFLIFDSGGQSFFSAGFFTPTSLATAARIGFGASKTVSRDDADTMAKHLKFPTGRKRLGHGINVGPVRLCGSPSRRTRLRFTDNSAL